MEQLFDQCLFHHEYDNEATSIDGVARAVSLPLLRPLVERGRAKLISTGGYSSICVREGSQGDVKGLPCGSRSLLIDDKKGAIIVRGVNKFFDFEDVANAWVDDSLLWASCTVWAQRKIAGFIVTLFALDDLTLGIMSKHVLDGPHVDLARRLLHRQLNPEQIWRVARDLNRLECSASFECVSLQEDYHHPILEDEAFDGTLTLLSIQRSRTLAEIAMPYREVQLMAEDWGVSCTPACTLHGPQDVAEVLQCTQQWHAVYRKHAASATLAEGIVLLVESAGPRDYLQRSSWVTPVRVKAKTVKYVALRSLRSILRADSQPQELLLHRAIASWAAANGKDLAAVEKEQGVSGVVQQFERHTSEQARLRFRDAEESVGSAYARLLAITNAEVGATGPCPLTLVMLCGLPGSGKSTLCKAILRRLQAVGSFDFAVHFSRDVVSSVVSLKQGIDEASSKHRQRRLGALVHRETVRWIATLRLYTALTARRGVVLFDACNATEATRRRWRQEFPSSLDSYRLLHVECSDPRQHLERMVHRQDHEVVKSEEDAQRALYVVRKRFVPPTEAEKALYVDTYTTSTEEAAERVVRVVTEGRRNDLGHTSVLSTVTLPAAVQQAEEALMRSLVGVSTVTFAAAANIAVQRRSSPQRTFAVDLQVTTECLLDTLSTALLRAFTAGENAVSDQRGTLRRWLDNLTERLTKSRWPAPPPDMVCVAGQTKWLKGWLFHGAPRRNLTKAVVRSALTNRYEHMTNRPHVTLLYSTDGTIGVAEFLSHPEWTVGSVVRVELTEVLIDRFAICFSATVAGKSMQLVGTAGEAESVPLHVTVGHSAKVHSRYSGEMFSLFANWQRGNEQLELEKSANRAKRSHQKFYNFLRLRLVLPIVVYGQVVVPL